MELGHMHINFGVLSKNEQFVKTIVVKNLSEMPLLYRICKSGSVASGTRPPHLDPRAGAAHRTTRLIPDHARSAHADKLPLPGSLFHLSESVAFPPSLPPCL